MTIYPFYLTDYPRLLSSFPFTIDIHQIDTVFPSHRHDFLEISFVIEGRGTETVLSLTSEQKGSWIPPVILSP